MRRATQANARGGRGGRGGGAAHGNNWRQFQHPHPHHQQQHAPYHQQYVPPAQPVPLPTGVYAQPLPAASPVAVGARADIQAEVAAFVESLRTSRSHPSAPPNALSVTAVAHAICVHFHVSDLDELLGAHALQLPALRQLQALNQRVWTFVTCFVQTRRVNTLFECFQAFLAHEGVREFHELRIGNSFVHTDAVQTLYKAPAAMLNVTTRDVLTHLRQFESIVGHDAFRHSARIDRTQFLQYLAQQYRQPNVESLGVQLDPAGFGVYISLMRRVASNETKELKALEHEFQLGIAEKVFEVTKDKFSAANRKRALDDLLQTHLSSSSGSSDMTDKTSERAGRSHRSTMASLSLEMLKRVTEIDVYLDNVLRRKAAAAEQRGSAKQISSQEIAETDVRIRNQLTRFVLGTQRSPHHSRIKVVTWVLCGIMAKIHALLLHDDKLPEDKSASDVDDDADEANDMTSDAKRLRLLDAADANDDDSDGDECDCCCVGKDTCKCACTCECHSLSSDEGDDDTAPTTTKTAPTIPSRPDTARPAAVSATTSSKTPTAADTEALRRAAVQYLTTYCTNNEVATLEHLLMALASLEIHLQQECDVRARDQSILELVVDLWSDVAHAGDAWRDTFAQLVAPPRVRSEAVASARVRAEVAQFVRQCVVHESLTHATARAQCEFGADTLEALGVASLDALLDDDASGDDDSNSSHIVRYSNVLLSTNELPSINIAGNDALAPSESVRAAKTDEAIAALRASPFLVDVGRHTQWQLRFAPTCGALRAFICANEALLRDHDASSTPVLFLFAWNGVVMRVDDAATPSALELLVSGVTPAALPNAHDVAVQLVSMLVKSDGQRNFPRQLVQAHLRTLLTALEAAGELPRFVLDVLLAAPLEFADLLFAVLADATVTDATASGASVRLQLAHRVWDVCASDIERRGLTHIAGVASSNSNAVWTDRMREHSASASSTDVTNHDVVAPSVTLERVDAPASAAPKREQIADRFARAQQQQHVDALGPSTDSDDTNTTVVAVPLASCRACIEQIRREQFGIGLAVTDDATAAVLAIQRQRLERALKRLSDELYSENTHFVLELLQNADDNSYAPHVRARGAFTLTAHNTVVFHNNERGFSRANIHAICDVGASTKALADARASIGKKGIGFKSVFKISDEPEVHSNGFHIRFHAGGGSSDDSDSTDGLGYILPHWIDEEAQWQQQLGTTFVLPLNAASQQRVDAISASLLAFEPSILLFLRRIEELCIADDVHGQQLHFLKDIAPSADGRHERVQLFSQITRAGTDADDVVTQQQWLVVKQTLQAPAALCSDGNTRETELALALPLEADGDDSSTDRPPPLQQVFAYLPLRSYGLRFIVQGDFEVPSSREAIVHGSEWNQWLVSQVPALLQRAVASFVDELRCCNSTDNDNNGNVVLARLTHLLALLPFEHEVQAPFRSVVSDMLRAMRETPLLPVQPPLCSSAARIELVPPTCVLDAWDAVPDDDVLDVLLRDGGHALRTALPGKQLLHIALAKRLTPQQKTQLRIERLRASHVLQLLALASAQNDVQWTVDVLRLLAHVWTRDRHAALLLQELRLLQCFPLQQQQCDRDDVTDSTLRWVSLADVGDALFLPSPAATDDLPRAGRDRFHGDLHVLHDTFAHALDTQPDVRAFLRTHVHVKTIEDHDLIAHHVLPRLASASATAPDNMITQYVAFLAAHVHRCGASCVVRTEIRAKMRVCTAAGRLAAPADDVFVLLPSAAAELPVLTPWLLARVHEVHDSTSSDASAAIDVVALDVLDADDALWRALFVETVGMPMLLDVADARTVAALKQTLTWLAAEPDRALKQTLSIELATFLDTHWPVSTDGACSADAAVVALLRKSKWLAGSDSRLHRAHKLWTPTPANRALFSDAMVPYSRVAWRTEALASDVLRLKCAPTLDDALDVLARLADNESATLPTLDAIARIYQFLADEAQRSAESAKAITQAFAERALLFTPARGFVAVDDAVWAATAYSSHLAALEQSYPAALRHFFTAVCGVARKPSIAALCAHVAQLGAFAVASDAKRQWKRELLPICRFFAKQVRKAALAKSEFRAIRRALKTTPWLPTVAGSALRWCATADAPLVARTDDEREVLKHVLALRNDNSADVLDTAQLLLVKLDAELLDELEPLLTLVKIRSLATHVVTNPSVWCDIVSHAVAALAADDAGTRKRVHKLLKRLVVAWANAFAKDASVWTKTDAAFQLTLQRSAVLPTLGGAHFELPTAVFVNDQTELSIEQLAGDSSDNAALPVLSLFPSSYFFNAPSDAERADDAARVRTFLLAFGGAKSLKEQLAFDVVVRSATQQPMREYAALRHKLQQSLGVAQRVLFHHHRALYDALPHAELIALTHDVRCVVVPGVGSLEVVYRVGAAFSVRHTPSTSFLDATQRVLYVVQREGDSDDVATARFHDVLLEVSRKCFGARVAASVANVLYLASLQPSAEATDKWLADTQQLAAVDPELVGALWAPPLAADDLLVTRTKRSFSSLEDGEVEDDDSAVDDSTKRLRRDDGSSAAQAAPQLRSDSLFGAVFPPLPPTDSSVLQHRSAGMVAPPPSLPPGAAGSFNANANVLPHQHHLQAGSGAFQPHLPPLPLPPSGGADQIVSVGNSMSKAERVGIGRWGEEYVYKQLVASYEGDAAIDVEWVNEHEESGKPYDITVSSRGNVVEYVEVKATRTMEKAVFEISMNELDQAAMHGSNYCIYRVFNAGNEALCRVVRMKNPVALVRQKKMQLALVMQ